MANNNNIVLGALGQDGSFMCDVLLEHGCNVFGIVKKNSDLKRYDPRVKYTQADIQNVQDLKVVIDSIQPDCIYNFAGITDVFDPWSNIDQVFDLNTLAPLRILEMIKGTQTRFLQASSSLIFGASTETPQNEKTLRSPVYPYGMSKKIADDMVSIYRDRLGLYACSAVMYNHDSERRRSGFFMKNLISQAAGVCLGHKEKVELGNIDEFRDIGYAKDYMYACYLMMNQNKPDDYIVSTGIQIQLRSIVEMVFENLGLSTDKNLLINNYKTREVDLSHLVGDNQKIRSIGWIPKQNIEELVKNMISYEMKPH